MSGDESGDVGVFLDERGKAAAVGKAFIRSRRGTTSTTFHYMDDYRTRPDAWALGPDLPLTGAATVEGLPGAMADSAPDRWGRNLIDKKVRGEAIRHGRTPPTATALDYLLGVSDLTRQGALRYCRGGPPFLAEATDVPLLVELPRLMRASEVVVRDSVDDFEAVKTLLDAGSGSLGGARPKASIRGDDGRLLIAKFPHIGDAWNVMAWEKTALDLADRCGVVAARRSLTSVGQQSVLLLERFDRQDSQRVPYVSAMTLTQSRDGDRVDYIELAESLAEHGAAVSADLRSLWQRIAFFVAVHNTDDHLRNHGFLRTSKAGWRLAPAFDVNPNPDPAARRVTSIGYIDDPDGERDALMRAAPYFQLDEPSAQQAWHEIIDAMRGWRAVATSNGIAAREIDRFAPALDRHLTKRAAR